MKNLIKIRMNLTLGNPCSFCCTPASGFIKAGCPARARKADLTDLLFSDAIFKCTGRGGDTDVDFHGSLPLVPLAPPTHIIYSRICASNRSHKFINKNSNPYRCAKPICLSVTININFNNFAIVSLSTRTIDFFLLLSVL